MRISAVLILAIVLSVPAKADVGGTIGWFLEHLNGALCWAGATSSCVMAQGLNFANTATHP